MYSLEVWEMKGSFIKGLHNFPELQELFLFWGLYCSKALAEALGARDELGRFMLAPNLRNLGCMLADGHIEVVEALIESRNEGQFDGPSTRIDFVLHLYRWKDVEPSEQVRAFRERHPSFVVDKTEYYDPFNYPPPDED